jgi:hypothetical protein
MQPTQGAISARGASEPQADAHPVARQVAAWRERGAADRRTVSEARPCLEEGESGATRVRPTLERWRAVMAAGRVARRSGHAPDPLARPEASQVLLVAACRRAGVEGLCVHRALGQRPADARRLHVQGRSAEDERATSLERHRRGKRPAAHVGAVHGLCGAPSGDRDGTTDAGGAQAR